MTVDDPQSRPWWWVQEPGTSGHVVDFLHLELAERRRLLDDLRAAVPTREAHDGGRIYDVHLHPDEIEAPHLRAAALILAEEELEFAASDEPGCLPDDDTEVCAQLLTEIDTALGDVAPSSKTDRQDHVEHSELRRQARANLSAIRFATAFARQNAEDDDESAFVLSVQAETALNAFWLGWRMRALDQKPFDKAARTGLKVRAGARLGGDMVRSLRPESAEILSAMDEALAGQRQRGAKRNVRSAATEARKKGFGTSVDANVRLFNRHRRK